MKRKCIYNGQVTDIVDFGGRAKVRVTAPDSPDDDKKIVSVKNVIPGQKIRFRLKRQDKGEVVEIIEKSHLETQQVCPVYGLCGGCVYSSVGYDEQLNLKKRMIDRLFGDILHIEKIYPSPQNFHYRNKMEYSFGDAVKMGPMTLGLHKRNSRYDVLNANNCILVHDDFNEIVSFTLKFFTGKGVSYYKKMSGEGVLRHLVLRRSDATGEILISLVTTTQIEASFEDILGKYAQGLNALTLSGKIAGILHTVNDSMADIVKDEGTKIIFGKDYIIERILGLEFKITPFSFFQTNSKGAEILYMTAREYALSVGFGKGKDKPVIFDLYSGTGTIAQIMAPVAKKVFGVEIIEEAVEAARENAVRNRLVNCEFIVGDVLKVIDEIKEKPDFIILDPPRDGVHPKALGKILDFGVENILYISCKPTSLLRDLEICSEKGYVPVRACCVDMFPGTGHVETVCLLSKLSTKHIHLDVSTEEFEPTRTEKQNMATYETIKQYVLEKFAMKVSTLYISQVKHYPGLPMRPHFNKSKSPHYTAPMCPEDKWVAIENALAHFGMI